MVKRNPILQLQVNLFLFALVRLLLRHLLLSASAFRLCLQFGRRRPAARSLPSVCHRRTAKRWQPSGYSSGIFLGGDPLQQSASHFTGPLTPQTIVTAVVCLLFHRLGKVLWAAMDWLIDFHEYTIAYVYKYQEAVTVINSLLKMFKFLNT